MSVSFSPAIVRRGLVQSLRFELSFVTLLGVVLPIILLALVEANGRLGRIDHFLTASTYMNSAGGALLCAIVSIAILRQLRFYPGVAVAPSILPVVAIVFGVLLAAIIGLRVTYSSKVLIVAFMGTLAARYAITAMRSRSKGLLYYLVPGGRVGVIEELPSAAVFRIAAPTLDNLPDCVIVADLGADLSDDWERFLAEAAISGRPIYHYKQVWEAETGRVQIDHLSENGFGALVPSIAYQKMKRVIDLVFCVLLLPFVIPVIAVCGILIKSDSEGPVFFRQRRMGFRGKVFHVLKLRTMTEGHDGGDRTLSVTQNGDQRITKIGHFLRQSRLDELPQIVNIIRGEMSWIGPRPEAVSLSALYENEIPFYRYRHIVRPGISGWAQVNQGHVADVSEVHEKLQYDFYYVKNLSYWLDIIIALRTIKVMLSGFGAK